MKKTIYTAIVACLLLVGCQKGDDYKNTPSNERQILWISAEGQMGMTQMPDKNGLDLNNIINIQVLPNVDITKLAVNLAVSPGATVSPASGSAQDFSMGMIEYTVTSQTGIERSFRVAVSVFKEVFMGTWSVASVNVTSDMDNNYGTPRWPAPGMGQRIGVVIKHNDSTPVYTPTTNGVEIDNVLTFEFSAVDANGNTTGVLNTAPGADGKVASKEIVSSFLTEININYKTGTAHNYPDDFFWLPTDKDVQWTRNISSGTMTLAYGSKTMKCTVTVVNDNTLTLMLPTNPNKESIYTRPNNDWYDRYDFVYNTVYTLQRISE